MTEPWNRTPGGWIIAPKPSARQAEEVWRASREGRTMICLLLNDSSAGTGWEVVLKDGDEWLFSRRCPDEAYARFIAKGLLLDHLRAGWTEVR